MNQVESAGSDFQLPWYVVRCKANAERTVAHGLSNRGLEVFLPLEKRASRRKNIGFIETPLFPGYVFARFEHRESLLVVSCPGVVHVLCRGSVPEPVDPVEIHSLLVLSRTSLALSPLPVFQLGERVRITNGPLADVEGIVVRDTGNPKLILSVSLLRRSVIAHVDREWIESLNPAAIPIQVRTWAATGA